jgi:hypothetical protein
VKIHRLISLHPFAAAIAIFSASWLTPLSAAELPKLDASLGMARATTQGDTLTVTTGPITRTWKLTPNGLRTTALASIYGTFPSVSSPMATGADWEAKGWIDATTDAKLVALTAQPGTDDDFTSSHLEVVAEFEYPTAKTLLRYTVWAFPGSDGLRTQLWFKNVPGTTKNFKTAAQPAFEIVKGTVRAAQITDDKELVLRVGPLDFAKSYEIAVQSPTENAATQTILLASVDNEASEELVTPNDPAVPVVAEISTKLRPDGFVMIRVKSTAHSPQITSAKLLESKKVVAEINATSLAAKQTPQDNASPQTQSAFRADWLPVTPAQLRAIGYFNDTQNRHSAATPLLREEVVKQGVTDWANILCSESSASGEANLALVKESHKCVNQPGVDTGAFVADENGIALTGLGITRSDVRATEWRWAWANWIIAYPGATASARLADQRELALKRFGRVRYPVRAELDLYIKANTWGSGRNQAESMARAAEAEVLPEIDSVADLGLDELQIDDGWQTGRMDTNQPTNLEWVVRPDWYPHGWTNVVARAAEKNIKLGIWHAARAPLSALEHNYESGGFKTWKLDFAVLKDYGGIHDYLAKGRDLIDYTHHSIRVNWDVTEIAPRFGYFWASECGNLWLANRKPVQGEKVVARPWLMLRESREVARYLNLNKIELPIQNFALVNTNVSDAPFYSTDYSTALGLPGIPVFFQTTRLLTPVQRAETRELLGIYKQHRAEMFAAFVFPIGDEPDNKSWSGFQWFNPDKPSEGYLLIFRERLNTEAINKIAVRFIAPGTKLTCENLLTGAKTEQTLDADRKAQFQINRAGDILFLKIKLSH